MNSSWSKGTFRDPDRPPSCSPPTNSCLKQVFWVRRETAGGLPLVERMRDIAARHDPRYSSHVNVHVNLPDDLVARIDDLSSDRSAFVAEAVRRALREPDRRGDEQEIARIN